MINPIPLPMPIAYTIHVSTTITVNSITTDSFTTHKPLILEVVIGSQHRVTIAITVISTTVITASIQATIIILILVPITKTA